MKVAILGGGGCFALNFARCLYANHIDCFGIGRSKKSEPFWLVPPGYQFYKASIGPENEPIQAVLDFHRPEIIVNFAAQGEGAASFRENAPDFFYTNDVALSQLVVHLMGKGKGYLKHFVQISSSEVYGSVTEPARETSLLNPTSPYAISKAAFDQYLLTMHRVNRFPVSIIRPSNCITEGQQLYRVVPKAAVCALTHCKLPLHGGGNARKSYLHADDLSRAILSIIGGQPGKVYNVGGPTLSIRTLVGHVAECCGISWEELVEEVGDRDGGQDANYALNCEAIAKDYGWTQTIGIGKAVERVVGWVKEWPELLMMPTHYIHRT